MLKHKVKVEDEKQNVEIKLIPFEELSKED